MRSVRMGLISANVVEVDVTCDCGENGLLNVDTQEQSTKHGIMIGSRPDRKTVLVCQLCSKRYTIAAQTGHLHVFNG